MPLLLQSKATSSHAATCSQDLASTPSSELTHIATSPTAPDPNKAWLLCADLDGKQPLLALLERHALMHAPAAGSSACEDYNHRLPA